ncbi:MAG: hypothetical protein K9G62_00065 [Alphaproteobacteria bacterium]|nr:hypothetical protein [Alphaproteobacteria bacterium]
MSRGDKMFQRGVDFLEKAVNPEPQSPAEAFYAGFTRNMQEKGSPLVPSDSHANTLKGAMRAKFERLPPQDFREAFKQICVKARMIGLKTMHSYDERNEVWDHAILNLSRSENVPSDRIPGLD